jgi:hypothetical protein
MNRFWDSKLTGAPPLLSWVVRRCQWRWLALCGGCRWWWRVGQCLLVVGESSDRDARHGIGFSIDRIGLRV